MRGRSLESDVLIFFHTILMSPVQEKYNKEVIPAMMKKFGYKSAMAVPRIKKIVVNCGFGKRIVGKTGSEREAIQKNILEYLTLITAQKPFLAKAKKSIADFKLREGMPIGAKVVLRGNRMYDFLGRLINLVIPRIRDFRGIDPKSVTNEGDLTIGFKEYTPFPEVRIEKEKGIFGLEVTITTTAGIREHGMELLRLIGMPLKS